MKKALVIVDVQNDFCPGGSYPVSKGDEVVEPLNKMIKHARDNQWVIVASRDWHPKETLDMPGWSIHCIQGTKGAKYHPGLQIGRDITIISKGKELNDKHYSAFNGDDISLEELLKRHNVNEVYVGGLALDYCVKNTAIDSVKRKFKTFVLIDACRAVNKKPDSGRLAIEEMKKAGVSLIDTDSLLGAQN